MKHIHTIALQGSVNQMRTRIAIEQGAMHQVQLSVARWRGDAASNPDCEPGPAMAASQAEWHAAAQCHFLCWLADGGFARMMEDAEQEAVPDLAAPATALAAIDSPASAAMSKARACCNNCTA